MESTAEFQCSYCGEYITTFIDLSAGYNQSYVEDCQVCCRPNLLSVQIDRDSLEVFIANEYNG